MQATEPRRSVVEHTHAASLGNDAPATARRVEESVVAQHSICARPTLKINQIVPRVGSKGQLMQPLRLVSNFEHLFARSVEPSALYELKNRATRGGVRVRQ